MSASRFVQFDNNGLQRTNELGYILVDGAFSFVECQEIRSASECHCLASIDSCLHLPCDLDADCTGKTLPLIDVKTQSPFVLKQGTLVKDITVAKTPNCCVPECASFCLGTIQTPDCATACDAQRWVTESQPITGAQLNKHGIVSVDLTNTRNISCPLFVCKTDACGNCTNNFGLQSTTCDGSQAPAIVGTSACSGCAQGSTNGCTLQNGNRCFFTGDGGIYAGELASSWIGLTLTNGALTQDCLIFQVTTKELQCATCEEDSANVCTFPKWVHGSF
jgi:hypothetical protein